MIRRPRRTVLLALLVLAALAAPAGVAARKPVLYLPDLAMEPPVWSFPGDDRVESEETPPVCGTPVGGFVPTAWDEPCPAETAGDRWLRFGSFLINIGSGPLRLDASRPETDPPTEVMTAIQKVKRSDGRWVTVASGATARWAEEQDSHPHWHTDSMERYRLFPTAASGATPLGSKQGFCFFDGEKVRPAWTLRSPSGPAFGFFSCQGYAFTRKAALEILEMTVGMSRGWGDLYPWNYAGQRIDISSLADGEYLLCLTADPLDVVREKNETNNESWSRITIATTAEPYSVGVTVLGSGRGACQDELPYAIAPLGAGSVAAEQARARRASGTEDGHTGHDH